MQEVEEKAVQLEEVRGASLSFLFFSHFDLEEVRGTSLSFLFSSF